MIFFYSEKVAEKRKNQFVRELCRTFLDKICLECRHRGYVTYGWGKSRNVYYFSVMGDNIHCITREERKEIFYLEKDENEEIKKLTTIAGGYVNETKN